MPIWKKIGLAVLSPLFVLLLFATAFDIGFTNVVTRPEKVKKLVAESGIYDAVVPNALSQVKSISTPYGEISADNPVVQQAAKAAITPAYIRQNIEGAIDNIYQWLDGKIARPDFNINLASRKTLFADNIAGSLQKQLSSLPACSLAQNRQIVISGNFDAANATCLPFGVRPAQLAALVKTAIVSQQDFLKDTDIKAASLKNADGQSIFGQAGVRNIPKQYQRAKKLPLTLAILTILCGTGVVSLSPTWRRGLRHVGINLLVIGVVMLVFSWILNRAVNTDIIPKIRVDNAIFQQGLRGLVTDVIQQINKNYWFFGGLYAGLGAISLAATISQKPGRTDANSPAGAARRPN